MSNVRPDVANNDRSKIRKETENFLLGITDNLSNYTPLEIKSFETLLKSNEATTASTGYQASTLTGAFPAVLPMQIAVTSQNNTRLEFTMLINPVTLNYGKTVTVNPALTRQGYIVQAWGPNQDMITSNGTTAAFYSEGIGLTNMARKRSFAYANFLAFFYAYRNNGYQFYDPTQLKAGLTRVINIVHGVEIFYDGQIFMGHFNNFTIDENADRPFLFDYNFEFVISTQSEDYSEVKGHFAPTTISGIARTLDGLEELNMTLG
jgi:hypothetical protein